MAKVYDVPADKFIEKLAGYLKNDKKIEPPSWSYFVKTGPHTEKIPQNKDWWYTRCASLLRKVYIHGPVSVADLKGVYGGKKQRGYNLAHHVDASGGIIRTGLKQLENSGYIVKKDKGRIISEDGMKRVDRLATELHKELQKDFPELGRYS
ncbi:MAG: 30S ribosomal protein S19e [Nitrososphaerales archaeon]|jgi:small subunit ribosomal protein S19e|nr:30S ribosomal protein S19e [Nitrososphaeraceae archaeon]HLN34270.1 30S ribosomal protein S19e [Nitrososphaeraceae archaeon]